MSREFALPGTRARCAPDRPVDVEHYRIAVALFPEEKRLTRHHRGEGHGAGARAAPPAPRRGRARDRRRAASGKAARVPPRRPRAARRARRPRTQPAPSSTLAIAYRGAPRRGLYFIAPDEGYPDKPAQVWTQGQDEDSRYWFPCLDTPNEKATTEVIVDVPGELVRAVERHAGQRPHRRRAPHAALAARRAALAATWSRSSSATSRRSRPGGATCRSSTTSQRGREADAPSARWRARRRCSSCSRSCSACRTRTRATRRCSSPTSSSAAWRTPRATTLTDTVLLDERAALDYDVDALVAHELAHQWFGDLVTCRDWGEGWLNEGFATYSEYLWREHYEGRDAADLELEDWARDVLRRGRPRGTAARSRPSTTTSRSTSSITTSTRRAAACCTCCGSCSATTLFLARLRALPRASTATASSRRATSRAPSRTRPAGTSTGSSASG